MLFFPPQSNQHSYNTTKFKRLTFNMLSVQRRSKLHMEEAEKNIKLYSNSINEHVTVNLPIIYFKNMNMSHEYDRRQTN